MCENAREIRKQFQIGLSRLVGCGIWNEIESWYPELNQGLLARQLGFESSSSLSRGLLTFDSLCTILTREHREWDDLPPMPAERDRILAGYCQAVAYHRFGRNPQQRPADYEILCMHYLTSHRGRRAYFDFRSSVCEIDVQRRNDIAEEVVRQVERVRGAPLPFRAKRPKCATADFLDELNQTWGLAYVCAVDAVALEVPA
jgi:hypothetical protein